MPSPLHRPETLRPFVVVQIAGKSKATVPFAGAKGADDPHWNEVWRPSRDDDAAVCVRIGPLDRECHEWANRQAGHTAYWDEALNFLVPHPPLQSNAFHDMSIT